MSVYDNNGSNLSGGRGCDRRFGAQRRSACGGDIRLPGGLFDIERALNKPLSVDVNATPCNPDSGAGSGCDFGGLASGAPSLAMVYCPRQYWRAISSPEEALMRGTLFSELYKPFDGIGVRK